MVLPNIKSVVITDNEDVSAGLAKMMRESGYKSRVNWVTTTEVTVSGADLIVEVAKVAADRKDWFPRGKWATIQSVQDRIKTK